MDEVLRRIEAEPEEPLTLWQLARDAAMSPYHFLRTFNVISGGALSIRPHTAPEACSGANAADDRSDLGIAYEAGFNDLSTFNCCFRRIMGMTPALGGSGGLTFPYFRCRFPKQEHKCRDRERHVSRPSAHGLRSYNGPWAAGLAEGNERPHWSIICRPSGGGRVALRVDSRN